ncbi:hypothetical protein ACLOJK_007119 [Asimina triloba]
MNLPPPPVVARVMRREGLDACQRHRVPSHVACRTKPPPRDSMQPRRKRGTSKNRELRFASASNKLLESCKRWEEGGTWAREDEWLGKIGYALRSAVKSWDDYKNLFLILRR